MMPSQQHTEAGACSDH